MVIAPRGAKLSKVKPWSEHMVLLLTSTVQPGQLLSCIWTGTYADRTKGFSLRDVGKMLIRLGVTHALIFEEGGDPYLEFCDPKNSQRSIRQKRPKRPAVFVFTGT